MVMSATCPFRGYASKKDNKKGGKGGKKSNDDDDEDSGRGKGKGGKSAGGSAPEEMSFDPLDLEKKMGQCLERLKKDFMTMRAGTANPGKEKRKKKRLFTTRQLFLLDRIFETLFNLTSPSPSTNFFARVF